MFLIKLNCLKRMYKEKHTAHLCNITHLPKLSRAALSALHTGVASFQNVFRLVPTMDGLTSLSDTPAGEKYTPWKVYSYQSNHPSLLGQPDAGFSMMVPWLIPLHPHSFFSRSRIETPVPDLHSDRPSLRSVIPLSLLHYACVALSFPAL